MDKEELTNISMEQFRELHGSNAHRYAYKNPITNKWVTWDDLDKRQLLIKEKDKIIKEQLHRIQK